MQQCMKLSLTNSPIGLIVLIDHAHQRAFGAVMMPFFVLTLTHPLDATLRTARATRRDGHLACMGATSTSPGHQGTNRRVKKTSFSKTHRRGKRRWIALSRPGGHGGAAAPVPIPNTAVKRPSANGTSS